MKPEPVYLGRQVLSALLVGAIGGDVFGRAVEGVLAHRYGDAAHASPGLGFRLLILLAVYASSLYWTRPLSRFLDTRDESLRPVAQRRFNGLYRLLIGLWAGWWLVEAFSAWRENPAAHWTGLLLPGAVGKYYGAYFTVLFLEPLLITRAARFLYTEPEIFRRKRGPMWSVHAKLMLMGVNLTLLPLALLALIRGTGGSVDDGAPVIIVTLLFAAGYLETLYRSIARPLAQLAEKMRLVAKGDYAAKTVVLDDDEIGELKAGFNEMVDGLAERERLKDTFGRYVSVEVAKRLVETGAVSLGGESIEATILFSDIRDFTAMSENMPPQELVAFLNEYFSYVTGPISAHNGMINKFIGDTVNVASRIESQNKDLGSVILVSSAVYERLSPELRARVRAERCDDVKVKGRARSLVLYKVL